jgi:hypothetical protein
MPLHFHLMHDAFLPHETNVDQATEPLLVTSITPNPIRELPAKQHGKLVTVISTPSKRPRPH